MLKNSFYNTSYEVMLKPGFVLIKLFLRLECMNELISCYGKHKQRISSSKSCASIPQAELPLRLNFTNFNFFIILYFSLFLFIILSTIHVVYQLFLAFARAEKRNQLC